MRLRAPTPIPTAIGLAIFTTLGCGESFSSDSSPSSDAGADGSDPDSGGKPKEIIATIAKDGDDCVWANGTDEELHFGQNGEQIEVGSDAEAARAGLRFTLPVPPGSIIQSAVLELRRSGGSSAPSDTILVQVYDAASVPPFDATHEHAPGEHAPGGLWPEPVGGFVIGEVDSSIESPNLQPLVQHVVDRPDWSDAGVIGFVLAPDTLDGWAAFTDSSAGSGARLRVVFTR